MAVHLAVADDVFDGVFFVLAYFPRDVLDEIWDCIVAVAENVTTYSYMNKSLINKNNAYA